MKSVQITLAGQDLPDFLEGNEAHEAYRAELERRLSRYFDDALVSVEIDSNALADKFAFAFGGFGGDDSDCEMRPLIVDRIMNDIVNDWDSWLPE